jgi:hypothetical protein
MPVEYSTMHVITVIQCTLIVTVVSKAKGASGKQGPRPAGRASKGKHDAAAGSSSTDKPADPWREIR